MLCYLAHLGRSFPRVRLPWLWRILPIASRCLDPLELFFMRIIVTLVILLKSGMEDIQGKDTNFQVTSFAGTLF